MVYRAAIIGCGMIGSQYSDDPLTQDICSHAAAYCANPDTELVAVCDLDPAKLARCGERWSVKARYSMPEKMLADQQPDIVSICTPDETHFTMLQLAMDERSTKGVLAEKPLTLDVEQARSIVQRASQWPGVLSVNYCRRFSRDYQQLRDSLKAGMIGAIQAVSGYYTKGLIHNGTHWIDLARFLIGEIQCVWGFDSLKESGPDPTLSVVLRFETGIFGHLHGCDADCFELFEMDIVGTRGRIRLTGCGDSLETFKVVPNSYYSGYCELVPEGRTDRALRDLLRYAVEDLVASMTQARTPICSARDGLRALMTAHAAKQSAVTQGPIHINALSKR